MEDLQSVPALMRFLSPRLFSLHVPVPPKLFLSMVYKFEGSMDVQVALELTTGEAGSCHVGSVSVLNGERLGDFMERRWSCCRWGFCGRGFCGRGSSHLGWNLWLVVITCT